MAVARIDCDRSTFVKDWNERGGLICTLKRGLFEKGGVGRIVGIDAGRDIQRKEFNFAIGSIARLEKVCK